MAQVPRNLIKKNQPSRKKPINPKPRSRLPGSRRNKSQPQKKDTESGCGSDDPDNPIVKLQNYDYNRLAENLSKAIRVLLSPVVERHRFCVEEKQKIC